MESHPEERQALLELAGETRAKYEALKWGEYQDKEVIIAQYLMQFFGKTIEESLKGEGKTITPVLKEKIREAAQGFLEDFERMRQS